jgi:hypothetical protein
MTATREDLIGRWTASYGCPPPQGVRHELLLYAAAWQVQIKQLGGFSPETRRSLKKAVVRIKAMRGLQAVGPRLTAGSVEGPAEADQAPKVFGVTGKERRRLTAGARLTREWNGRTYVVDVVEGGYLFEGTRHRSLSVIARAITGAHWSGPRFFGL